MKVLVEKVYPEDEEENEFESWIQVKLQSGQRIELYTQKKTDLRKYIGKIIDCLISPWLPWNINQKLDPGRLSLEGIYIGKFEVPPKYLEVYEESIFKNQDAIEADKGMFLIGCKIAEDLGLILGDKIKFNFSRYGLWAWLPIEE